MTAGLAGPNPEFIFVKPFRNGAEKYAAALT
jgi:hypothetical protein